jgi:hypothetical protein
MTKILKIAGFGVAGLIVVLAPPIAPITCLRALSARIGHDGGALTPLKYRLDNTEPPWASSVASVTGRETRINTIGVAYCPVIPSVARNPALVCGGRNQSEIPCYARNDILA